MKRLKIVLQHKTFYAFLIFIALINILMYTRLIKYESKYKQTDNSFLGEIIDIEYKDNYVLFTVFSKEKILCRYYYKDIKQAQKDLLIGNKILVKGELTIPKNNTNPNQFNYKKYLYNKKIYYILNVKSYKISKETLIYLIL